MKKLAYLIAFILLCNLSFATKIDKQTAKTVAENFYSSITTNNQKNKIPLSLFYECKSPSTNQKSTKEPVSYYYIFNASDNKGFVIISGDDATTPVLAYSLQNNFDTVDLPLNLRKWLDGYKNEIAYAITHQEENTENLSEEWAMLISGDMQAYRKSTSSVNPLITTTWNQSPYYNDLCPYDNTKYERTVTGCVATAMAQIMKFWNYPTQGTGFRTYTHNKYGTLSVNFAATTYNWSSMPNNVSSTNNAVATLMYHCGVSVDMNYGVASEGGSGAYVYLEDDIIAYYGLIDARTALKNYFGYKDVKGYNRDDFSLSTWITKLKTELDAGHPILYAGSGTGGGHAFVCDGYDNDDKFHMNWGWGGYYDGYFVISALNPSGTGTGGGTGGFNSNQMALLDIYTSTVNPTADIRLYDDLYLSSSNIMYMESFSLQTDIGNYSANTFNGKFCLAAFDEDGNFLTFVDSCSATINSMTYKNISFSTDGLLRLTPGSSYYLAVFYRSLQGEWTMVDDGNYDNIAQLDVYYYSDIEMYSDFSFTPKNLTQGEALSVECDVLNDGDNTFFGTFYLELYDIESGELVFEIDNKIISDFLPGYHFQNGLTFSCNKLDVEPGSYILLLSYEYSGSYDFVGSYLYRNPIIVIVQAPPTLEDAYEPNNDHQSAANLTVNFSGNTANVTTNGSTLHSGITKDYYKIILPTGYDYAVMAEVFDLYNQAKGQDYSCDVIFSYFTGATDWSEVFDEKMNDTLFVSNGGSVYFSVSPYSEGATGSYLLDIFIRRIDNSSISEKATPQLLIYPNPVNDELTIDNNQSVINDIKIYDILGKEVKHFSINASRTKIAVNDLHSGIYILQIETPEGTVNKKITKQ